MAFLGRFLLFCAMLSGGFQPAHADNAGCELEHCWDEVFPQIRRLVVGGTAAVRQYQRGFHAKNDRIDRLNPGEEGREQQILEHRLALIQQYLEECKILRDGPRQPRHLIIIGHALEDDGLNQRLAGLTVYQDRLEEVCGPAAVTPAYERCRRSIVIFEDINKQDLSNFLRLLGSNSVRSLTYTGHGIESALVLGPKDLLLPVTWSADLRVSRGQWRRINVGMLYSRDVVLMAPLIQRVMAPSAPVALYACDTGVEFAPVVQSVLRRSTVQACLVPMHYEYLGADGEWHTDWNNPVPADAARTRLVPDAEGMFIDVEPARPGRNAEPPSPVGEPRDRATRDIVLRLAIGSAREGAVDDGRRILHFADSEIMELRSLAAVAVRGRSIDPSYDFSALDRSFDHALQAPGIPAARTERLRRLREKLRDCIDEAVRLYYR